MRTSSRQRATIRRVITATFAVACAVALGGCAALVVPARFVEDRQLEQNARHRVAGLAREMSDARPDDIDGWARAAVTEIDSGTTGFGGIDLIGIHALDSSAPLEPLGWLEFRVPSSTSPGGESTESCFRVTFDRYGNVGERSTSDGVEPIACPAGAAIVTPPPDTRTVTVTAPNARDVAHAVLGERAATGLPAAESEIAASIASRLEPPPGTYEIAAPPRALVDTSEGKDRVGVAMGFGDDCVLVKSENGVVTDVYPPRILLQPGELGCYPSTALLDPEQLRPPH